MSNQGFTRDLHNCVKKQHGRKFMHDRLIIILSSMEAVMFLGLNAKINLAWYNNCFLISNAY